MTLDEILQKELQENLDKLYGKLKLPQETMSIIYEIVWTEIELEKYCNQ